MATVKVVSSKASIGVAINYVTRLDKTRPDLISGQNLNPGFAAQQMQITKKLYGKTGGRTYKHFIQSYHRDEKITPEYAHALAQEFAAKAGLFRGFEVLIATHTDREHIHTHFIVNSVNAETGRKIHMDASNLKDLRDLSDDICREHGLTVTEPGKSFSGEKKPAVTASKKGTYQVLQKGMQGEADSYVCRIFLAVINAISSSRSKEQFIDLLKQKKIDVTWTARKYITFTDLVRQMEGESKCKIRNSKLEKYFHTDFSKEALLRQFEMNDRIFKEMENHEWPVQLTAEDCRIIYEHIRYAFWAMEEDEIYSFPSFRLTKMVIKYTQPSPAIKEKIKTYIDQSEIMQRKREAGMLLPVTAVVKPGPKKSKHENEFLTELKKEMGIDMPQQRARQRDWGFELD